jgi:predicted nucleic acid-binding protein
MPVDDNKRLRVYIDASVFGGYFDDEFRVGTEEFFTELLSGTGIPLVSDTLVAELAVAPEAVQSLLERVLDSGAERLLVSDEVEELRDKYVAAQVLSHKWSNDAMHVAHASMSRADVIVSWNFKHLVNPLRIRGFNGVNAAHGFRPVVIMTPEDLSRAWKEQSDEKDS